MYESCSSTSFSRQPLHSDIHLKPLHADMPEVQCTPVCHSLAAVAQAPVGPPTGKRLTGQTVRFASASTPGDTGTLSPQPLDALEKHLDSLESEPSNGLGHEVRAKARQALQCLLEGNRRFCQVRAGGCEDKLQPIYRVQGLFL